LLTPGYLAAAGAVAAVTTGLHFLATRDPETTELPTARFVPAAPLLARTAARRFSHPWLLLLRVVAVMLIGLVLAGPTWSATRRPVLRIVAIDTSRAVGRSSQMADSVRRYLPGATVVLRFDRSLSTALIAALRAASQRRDAADSADLTIVSPFAAEEWDAATPVLRARWPGHVRLVHVPGAAAPSAGAARVVWVDSVVGQSDAASAWVRRAPVDTIGAVGAGDVVVVAPFARRWQLSGTETQARVIARWADGEPAAIEHADDRSDGCTRTIAIPVPRPSDISFRPGVRELLVRLAQPCAPPFDATPAPPEVLAQLAGSASLAPMDRFDVAASGASPFSLWCLAAGIAALVAELRARRTA
jgi:hypothetical protein